MRARLGIGTIAVGLLGVAWLGCRQLAGIDDVELGGPSVDGSTDGGPDAPFFEGGFGEEAFGEGGSLGCGCPGCTVLATDQAVPVSLVVHGGDVYVLNYGPEDGQGSLVRVPSAGGATQTVEGTLTRPFSLATDGTDLYWQAEDGKGAGIVVKRPIAGGSPVTLAQGLPALKGVLVAATLQYPLTDNVAVTSSDVYFVGYPAGVQGGVLSVPKAGGTVSTLIDHYTDDAGSRALSVNAIATDGTAVYGVTNGAAIGVFRAPVDEAGAPQMLVQNLLNPWTLTLSGADVAFLDDGLNFTNGTVQLVPREGGSASIDVKGLRAPWSIAAGGDVLYFAVEEGRIGGSVDSYDVSKRTFGSLAIGLLSPAAVAVDSTEVYFVDAECGTVTKIHR